MTPPSSTAHLTAKAAAFGVSFGTITVGVDMGEYGVIGAGLLIGVMARYAVSLSVGTPCGWRELRIDALVLLMNGLLALEFGETFSLHGVKLAVASAMFGASSTMVFMRLHEKFLVTAVVPPTAVFASPSSTLDVPARNSRPLLIHSVGPQTPMTPADVAIQVYTDAAQDDAPAIDDLLGQLYKIPRGKRTRPKP